MISFYPGPSRIHDEIPQYVKEAHKLGILSINHRSEDFMRIMENTDALLKEKLRIPKSYSILYTSSATECWEIIAQSLITKKSYHLYNGAFGQKWYDYTRRMNPGAEAIPFDKEEKLDPKKLTFATGEAVICLTQNETSNGTQVSNAIIRRIKKNNPGHLIAVDATSSMGGINLDFKAADIWFASVQKCFGLPAGLGIMVCSPQAVALAKGIDEKNHYNSMPFMLDMMEKWQTPFTPNVLTIYLLLRSLEKRKGIRAVHEKTVQHYNEWFEFFRMTNNLQHFIRNKEVHSFTVIPVEGDPVVLGKLKNEARKNGLLLGEGYGELKPSTFRIANFPAIKKKEIKVLKKFLKSFV